MPWNDASKPGPWGAPPSGPPEDGPSKPARKKQAAPAKNKPPKPPTPVDFNAVARRPAMLALVAAMALTASWAASGYHDAGKGKKAAVYEFGALVAIEDGPGYHLPSPFGRVVFVSTEDVQAVEGGGPGHGGPMATADGRLADIRYVASWRVTEPRAYLRSAADPAALIKTAAEAGVDAAAATFDLEAVRKGGQKALEEDAAKRAQAILDDLDAGVRIQKIEISSAELPAEVRNDPAAEAPRTEAERKTAEADKAARLAKTREQAEKLIAAAMADAERTRRLAREEAARFDRVLAEANAAPAGARQRIYSETMAKILARSNKIIIDAPGANVQLPPEVLRRAAPTPPPPPGGKK